MRFKLTAELDEQVCVINVARKKAVINIQFFSMLFENMAVIIHSNEIFKKVIVFIV